MQRGCQLLRKDRLLDEDAFLQAQTQNETINEAVSRLGMYSNLINNISKHIFKAQYFTSVCKNAYLYIEKIK